MKTTAFLTLFSIFIGAQALAATPIEQGEQLVDECSRIVQLLDSRHGCSGAGLSPELYGQVKDIFSAAGVDQAKFLAAIKEATRVGELKTELGVHADLTAQDLEKLKDDAKALLQQKRSDAYRLIESYSGTQTSRMGDPKNTLDGWVSGPNSGRQKDEKYAEGRNVLDKIRKLESEVSNIEQILKGVSESGKSPHEVIGQLVTEKEGLLKIQKEKLAAAAVGEHGSLLRLRTSRILKFMTVAGCAVPFFTSPRAHASYVEEQPDAAVPSILDAQGGHQADPLSLDALQAIKK